LLALAYTKKFFSTCKILISCVAITTAIAGLNDN
jgi:hypothetical protein